MVVRSILERPQPEIKHAELLARTHQFASRLSGSDCLVLDRTVRSLAFSKTTTPGIGVMRVMGLMGLMGPADPEADKNVQCCQELEPGLEGIRLRTAGTAETA